jgi:hypothetical protein
MRRSFHTATALLVLVLGGPWLSAQSNQVNRRAAALAAFSQRIQGYLDVRQKAVSHFEPLKPDADQATIAEREKVLGEAIRTARTGAKAGDLFGHDVAPIFRALTKEDFGRRSTHGKKLRLDELPHFEPVINQSYPSSWPLQTFPPTLLAALPKLPPELEYRFVDNALILRDTKANLVIDFLRDVM